MNFIKLLPVQSLRLYCLVLVTTCTVSSCSDTSESAVNDTQPAVSSSDFESNEDGASNTSSESVESNEIESNESESNETASNDGESSTVIVTDDEIEEDDENDVDAANNDPVVVDPLIQNIVPVNFDITVPAYQSNELRVELDWGDRNLVANWVGDEYWSASSEFPTETEELLTVTFYDLNGDLELAVASLQFRTGTNAAEAIKIDANQFDTTEFDTDGDGVNNLDELIAGTDPSLDEDSLLSIVDSAGVNYYSRMTVWEDEETVTSEYFARNISMSSESSYLDSTLFLCDFVDF